MLLTETVVLTVGSESIVPGLWSGLCVLLSLGGQWRALCRASSLWGLGQRHAHGWNIQCLT